MKYTVLFAIAAVATVAAPQIAAMYATLQSVALTLATLPGVN